MTLTDVFEQARGLPREERRELAKLLIDTLTEPAEAPTGHLAGTHWGRTLNQLLAETGAIEFVDPHLTDPVEWVNRQRQRCHDQLDSPEDAGQ
jgi:hypothetical protein